VFVGFQYNNNRSNFIGIYWKHISICYRCPGRPQFLSIVLPTHYVLLFGRSEQVITSKLLVISLLVFQILNVKSCMAFSVCHGQTRQPFCSAAFVCVTTTFLFLSRHVIVGSEVFWLSLKKIILGTIKFHRTRRDNLCPTRRYDIFIRRTGTDR
jgi:hypothetical protein